MNPLALLAGGAVIFAIGFGSAWTAHGWKSDAEISSINESNAKASAEFEARARKREQELNYKLQEAQNASKEREKKLLADAGRARLESDRLRDDINDIQRRLPELTEAAVRKYADAASIVLNECRDRYTKLAKTADQIDNDRQTLIDAWPK